MDKALQNQGFSLWCDFIERDFLTQEFPSLIQEGKIFGATSNPSIFAQSFKNSPAYQEEISSLQHKSAKEIYETLAIKDIKTAAKLLHPIYDLDQDNGYVSIEIDPLFCDDAQASILEGKRLFQSINEPNVMIKVPATKAGYEVMEELLKQNIPINATLIFSPTQALECAYAFQRARKAGGKGKSVISVFVSRLDRALDPSLPPHLQKKLGITNAKHIYNLIEELGDRDTRTLFASTGVKDHTLAPSYYVDELLLPHSLNTAPLETIHAYFANNDTTLKESASDLSVFKDYDLSALYKKLLQEGLEAFKVSFKDLLDSLKS
ncbi:transaldolase [Helicobacter kayseriensis]|uniref:transaldolase n=1 Tax=Helicobacter kayseriensis TaxID=2905877 RepID=UPI001E5BA954|nr:transaldolase [Helicobacter kayseriensis]MCE3047493.1 transaldolase [Helicobacter kayseriensis]MCE3048774.1 transaldolase [Helicobacter kayseriensis]